MKVSLTCLPDLEKERLAAQSGYRDWNSIRAPERICTFQRNGRQIAKSRMRYDAETSARRSSAPHSASILENKERE